MSCNDYEFCVPESFSRLKKLNLYRCSHIYSLPENVAKLDILRLFGMLDHPRASTVLEKGFPVRAVDSDCTSSLVWLKHTNPDVLGIMDLENVKSVEEAHSIRLMEKQRIEYLSLEWSRGVRSVEQNELLTELLPPRSVKIFKIGYEDAILPHWFMRISKHLPNLVRTDMGFLPCSSIPALAQLPNLRQVVLRCTDELNTNLGVDAANELTFPKLESLQIDCHHKSSSIPSQARAQYLHLSSGECTSSTSASSSSYFVNKLKIEHSELPLHQWRLLHHLHGLRDLTISGCNDLTISPQIPRAFASLESLSLVRLRYLNKLPEWLGELTCLRQLKLKWCYNLQEFHKSMRQLTHLQSLILRGCHVLTSLPQWLGELTLLRTLTISFCKGIISLPESIPTNLQKLYIRNCPELYVWCKLEKNQMKLAHIKEKVFLRSAKASGSRVDNKGKTPTNIEETTDLTNMTDDEVHPNLYGLMDMRGFTPESLRVAFSHLVNNEAHGRAYLGMHEEDRLLWLTHFVENH